MSSRRLELGLEGGTVLRVTVSEQVAAELTTALAAGDEGWREVVTDDSACHVNLDALTYVRIPHEGPRGIGFKEG